MSGTEITRLVLITTMMLCVTAATIALSDLRIMWFMLLIVLFF